MTEAMHDGRATGTGVLILLWPAALGLMAAVGQLASGVDRVPLTITVVVAADLLVVPWWAALCAAAAGMLFVGLPRAAHGIWDVIHLRSRTVVSRSLALA